MADAKPILDPLAVARTRSEQARAAALKAEDQLAKDRKALSVAIEAKAPTETLELIAEITRLGQIRVVHLTHFARDYETIASGKRVFT